MYRIFYKKLVYKKRVLGRSKIKRLVLCSRKIKKLYDKNLSKKECLSLLPLVKLCDFIIGKIYLLFDLLGYFS